MISNLNTLPIDQRIQLVEDLWDSIAEEKLDLPITQQIQQIQQIPNKASSLAIKHLLI